MAANIYPDSARENCLANMYCEIAMESYYHAYIAYTMIRTANYSHKYNNELSSMNKSIVTTIIFSAMTIEAFINDYAAACLGDSDFYDNFDKLSLTGKFKLVSKFILKNNRLDNSNAYSMLCSLIKSRNSYVHCKSRYLDFSKYSLDEIQDIEHLDSLEEEDYKFDYKEIKNNIDNALNAIKTIYEIALYFDKYDFNVSAIFRLFNTFGLIAGNKKEQQYKTFVFQKLGLITDKL